MKTNDLSQFSRQQVRTLGLAATTLTEIAQARQILEEWQCAHPSEPPMFDVFEQLYIMEDAWRTLAAEPADLAA